MNQKLWHTKTTEELLKDYHSSITGLSELEASARLEKYGTNELRKKKKTSLWLLLWGQLKDPLILLLIIAIIFSALIGETVDALAIIFIVIIDVIMGTYQEYRALSNAAKLASLINVEAKVKRDGIETKKASSALVVGDIVLLESGDKISADMRLIEAYRLQIDESVLTGESTSVFKQIDSLAEATILAERSNMVYAGTSVLTGRAIALVVATGTNTEIGHIAEHVLQTKETKSPLTIRMEKFSKQLSLLVISVAVVMTVLLFLKQTPVSAIFLSVIALSVSAMPEGLPLALTMALTIASNRMAKKQVLVKKLAAVESLGSCTVIASDKTGTLTVNEQTAKKIVLASGASFTVSGTGYHNKGKLEPSKESNDKEIDMVHYLALMGAINNEATITEEGKNLKYHGDSIDLAFLFLAQKLGVNSDNCSIKGEIPYESEQKYSACFYEEETSTYCTVKGSVEKVLSFCSDQWGGDTFQPLNKQQIEQANEHLAAQGYRVIALAYGKAIARKTEEYQEKDISNLHYIGLVAFIDPIREDAKEAISQCQKAGIKVMMITGDHPLTAFSIAQELGLVSSVDEVVKGDDVDSYLQKGEKAFDEFIKQKRIFARVTPTHKLEIINAYKRQGEFVAVTGDGVNDAPALKAANIGIAMGSGTDVAKETASLILLNDRFSSIIAGIKEGRNAYSNIRKVSYMLLSCGMAEVIFFLLSIALNLPMPLVAIQLLWLNIVTDGLQDFALSFEKAEPGIMEEVPKSPKESIFNKVLLREVIIAGLTIGLTVFGVFFYLIKTGTDITLARSYIMVLMVFMQNMHVLNCRSEKRSVFKTSLLSNPFIIFSIVSAIILQIIVSEVEIFSTFLQTVPVPIEAMIQLFILSSVIILVIEIYKKIMYGKKNH